MCVEYEQTMCALLDNIMRLKCIKMRHFSCSIQDRLKELLELWNFIVRKAAQILLINVMQWFHLVDLSVKKEYH